MRKLFFAICFNLVFCWNAFAGVHVVSGYENLTPQTNNEKEIKQHEVELEEFQEILKDGIENALTADPEKINQNVSYIPSALQENIRKENEKGLFQKIYEQALGRVKKESEEASREDIISDNSTEIKDVSTQQDEWQDGTFPVVTAYLPPNNAPVSVPALEHISYLMNSIEVLPTGLVKFEETVVVVANGVKLRRGLTKILPTKVYNEFGKAQNLDYSVIGVRVNDMPVEYHLIADGKNILLVPDEDYELAPGIYTYKFEYVVDNLLWESEHSYGIYWNVAGGGWNLVVDRLGASLSLPQENAIMDQLVFIGDSEYIDENAINARPNGRHATAYIANRPLFIGEGMYLVAYISKEALFPPTIWQRVMRSFYDYGDIYLALLGAIIIALSFKISWRYIAKDKGQLKLSLNKTAMVIRYLLLDRFDAKSVCGFILELYKKNIIDIQQSGETILLVKRTDNVKSLKPYEQKALRYLFPGHETMFNVTKQNLLPFKRFAAVLEKGLRAQMLKFRLKLNVGYLVFSLGMLLITEAFIASFKINSFSVFAVMAVSTLLAFGAIALWYCSHRRWLKILARLLSLDIIIGSWVILSAVVNPLAALFLLSAAAIIVFALTIYAKRMGLIKHYIQDVSAFKEYLKGRRDNIVLGKEFLNHQAAIWAYDMEDEFVPMGAPEYYKLPIMKNIMKCLK